MKILCVSIVFVCALVGLAQTGKSSKTPVEILYGPRDPAASATWPVISGVMNSKAKLETLPIYPQRAKEKRIEGQVEVQLLVNEDGEVIFANPQSGPEALWAESALDFRHCQWKASRAR